MPSMTLHIDHVRENWELRDFARLNKNPSFWKNKKNRLLAGKLWSQHSRSRLSTEDISFTLPLWISSLDILVIFTDELHCCRVTQALNSISESFEILTPDHICPDFFNLLVNLFNSDTGAHDCTWIIRTKVSCFLRLKKEEDFFFTIDGHINLYLTIVDVWPLVNWTNINLQ